MNLKCGFMHENCNLSYQFKAYLPYLNLHTESKCKDLINLDVIKNQQRKVIILMDIEVEPYGNGASPWIF